jgi:Sigma-70, region 4
MRETVASVQDKDRAALPGWVVACADASDSALPYRFPGQPGERQDRSTGESPEQVLHAVAGDLSGQLACHVGWSSRLGKALVFRAWPLRSLHVVGGTPMAGALRELIASGAAPGWELHPVPGGRTALHALAAPLYRLTGQQRFYNLLDREGFAWAEEVAATPDACLLSLRNSGPRFIATVRQALSELGLDDISAGPGGARESQHPRLTSPPPAVPAELATTLQFVARWAIAEHGASSVGDLLTLAPGITGLPADVARSWDQICQVTLQALTGTARADRDLAQLAGRLLGEVADDRRRLILTCRTFAPQRRTYDSLAAELGISRERVRQLETSALEQLARAAVDDPYAPLRWRAASAGRPGTAPAGEIPGAPPWMGRLLAWLADKTA